MKSNESAFVVFLSFSFFQIERHIVLFISYSVTVNHPEQWTNGARHRKYFTRQTEIGSQSQQQNEQMAEANGTKSEKDKNSIWKLNEN